MLRFALALLLIAPAANATEWRTIGAPGNRDTNAAETPWIPPSSPRFGYGAVDYEYRLARNEVSSASLLEFFQAYAPYMPENDTAVAHGSIEFVGFGEGRVPIFQLANPDWGNRPGQTTWNYWARYVNWLHNDQALTQDAFESGVYDTSFFGVDDHAVTRAEGARFWIPSQDEWVKGMYYDPNRYGEGEGGYWLYPDGGNEPLEPGFPGEGGETNAGPIGLEPPVPPNEIGAYPDTQSPWGLLDGSGGVKEWLEDPIPGVVDARYAMGSSIGDELWQERDRIDLPISGLAGSTPFYGLRLAAVVPSPGGVALLTLIPLAFGRRR